MYSFVNFEPVHCSMSSANNYCLLTCIHVSQEVDKMVWYSHLLKNFPVYLIHVGKGFSVVNEVEEFITITQIQNHFHLFRYLL